jgi:nucleoside-diphosphate-sugar epimerase
MIIGSGLIAKNLQVIDRNDILFFASGVSNSMCDEKNEYERELNLLKKSIDINKKLIYFSSIDQYIVNQHYLDHKKEIEDFIKKNTNDFIIMKIPQLIGKNGNPSNFINYLYSNIKNSIEFDIFLTKRSLLDVEDLVYILNFLIKKNFKGTFDLNYIELMSVNDFVKILEDIIGKKAKIKNTIEIKQNIIDNDNFVDSVLKNIIGNTNFYNTKTIKKYFS